jgi:hypothetical protein
MLPGSVHASCAVYTALNWPNGDPPLIDLEQLLGEVLSGAKVQKQTKQERRRRHPNQKASTENQVFVEVMAVLAFAEWSQGSA